MNKKIIVAGLLVIAVVAFFVLGLDRYASLDMLQEQQEALQDYHDQHPVQVVAIFMLSYIAVTALSLPVATILTLLGGALFGFNWGLVMSSFASSIGATIAFLLSRYLFRDAICSKYGQQLEKINEGIKREGAFYLFALRLTPVFPFFVINAVMGVLSMPIALFYLISQVGMLPATAVYVFAGTQLAEIDSITGIVSLPLLLAFCALGIFPLVIKKGLAWMRAKRGLHGEV